LKINPTGGAYLSARRGKRNKRKGGGVPRG
jgi:hypothetical protein